MRLTKLSFGFFVYLAIVLNFLFPTFNSVLDDAGRIGAVYFNLVVSFLLVFVFFVFFESSKALVFCLAVFLLIFFIELISLLVNSPGLQARDVFELQRPFFYFLCASLGVFSFDRMRGDIYRVVNFVVAMPVFLGVAFFVLSFFDYYQIFAGFYTKSHNLASLRITSVFVNPYDFAFLLSLSFAFFSYNFFYTGGFVYCVFAFLSFLLITLTQSKKGFLCVVFVLMIYFLVSVFFVRRLGVGFFSRLAVSVFFSIFLLLFLIELFAVDLNYLVNGLSAMASGDDTSTNLRLSQIDFVIDRFGYAGFESFFGFGPDKGRLENLENLFFLYFYRYGVLGLIFVVLLVLFPMVFSVLILSRRLSIKGVGFFVPILAWFLCVIPAGFANNVIDQIRINFIYFFLFGGVSSVYFHRNPSFLEE